MARRDYRQLNLAETLLGGRKGKNVRLGRLHEIHELIAWGAIDALLTAINNAQKGADGYPPLCLVDDRRGRAVGSLLSDWPQSRG